MIENLKDRWALILGASSGHGAGTSLELARSGMNIFGVHLDMRATLPQAQHIVNTIKDLRAALRNEGAEIERLTSFIEEVRDFKPEIHSGRMADPQDDVPDVIEADVFLTFQEDAKAALEAKT